MPELNNSDTPDVDPERRLEEILKSNRVIRFFENIPDKQYSFVTCSIYGAPKTNELFVKLSNGRATFVEAVFSRLIMPPMEDRIFGLDVMDHQDAFGLADRMWEKHRAELLKSGGGK